jgi:hypothetical protein
MSALVIFNLEKAIAAPEATSVFEIDELVAKDPKPKFVLAAAAVVAPVPPLAISIVEALHTPEVIVPTVAKLAKEVNVVLEVAVMFPAVEAVVAFPKKLGAVISVLNVFAPAIVCEPVESRPGFVPSAAVKVKVVPLIVPPFADPVVEYAKVETPAVIPTFPAAVKRPLLSTVKVGIAVDDP